MRKSTGVIAPSTFMAYTWCCSQLVAICSYRMVSPELAGNLRINSSRKPRPSSNGKIGLEKIRFIDEPHLTMKYQLSRTANAVQLFDTTTENGRMAGRHSYR